MNLKRPGLIFLLVFGWKVALFLLSTQPVPANDAFFYDGAVVNRLLNGGYFNPSLAAALPISGTEVFCAYPPLHQAALLGWMAVFGVSAWTAMTFHLTLVGVYLLLLWAIFRRLGTPAWAVGLAGIYGILLTFHDRPDTLGHTLGMAAVYAGVRWLQGVARGSSGAGWIAAMVAAVVLCFCTSLQIGAIYFLLVWVLVVGATFTGWTRFPTVAMAGLTLAPVALVALVKFGFPHLWTGFLEHARQTPSFTGLRMPYGPEILKVVRTAPGVIVVAALLPLALWRQGVAFRDRAAGRGGEGGMVPLHELLAMATLLAGLAVVLACLFVLTANTVAIANYLQPLLVGCFLGMLARERAVAALGGKFGFRLAAACLLAGAALGSVRAVGMTTWGLACAWDVNYAQAIHRVDTELSALPPGSVVVLSSAFLYEAARHPNVRWLHSDWLVRADPNAVDPDLKGLRHFRPRRVIVSQFDYYRRYGAVLDKLRMDPGVAAVKVDNMAHRHPPDAYPSLQRVVQHISWAPVVVEIDWR